MITGAALNVSSEMFEVYVLQPCHHSHTVPM